MKQQIIEKMLELQMIKYLFFEQKIIDEVQVLYDLVVQIQKYFTEFEILNIHPKNPM